jgi:iron-sulfur cluster assembly protein
MVTLTEKAAEKMKEALQQEGKPDFGLRLIAQAGGCSCCGPSYGLFPEKETQPQDTVLTQGGVNLFIDPVSLALLEGATIDFINHPEHGQGFTIRNPKLEAHAHEQGECGCSSREGAAEGSCGCGGNCSCGQP